MSEAESIIADARAERPWRAPVVLQVLPHMGAGGVPRGTLEVARALGEVGWTALVASAAGDGVNDLAKAGVEHVAMPLETKNPLAMRRNARRLAALIEERGVDLVHARSRAPAWSAAWAARATGRPFVTTFHGTYGHRGWLKRRYNAVMTRGDRVIAISDHIAAHIEQVYGVGGERVRVIHRGVDPNLFDPAKVSAPRMVRMANLWRLQEAAPVVMMPGRLTRWKGQLVLIEALARLNRPDVRCLIIGDAQGRDGYVRELRKLIAKYGLTANVQLIDHCHDMPAAYMHADVVVSASTDPEAFGRVMIEAQAMGRPVVASDHGGARETVVPGVTGWLVPPGDAQALADRIEEALALSPMTRAAMARAASEHVRARFSTALMCSRTVALYREVLDAAGA